MQKIFTLEPMEIGAIRKWSTALLEVELKEGWRIVEATPVMKSINQVSSTAFIIYILEKEDE